MPLVVLRIVVLCLAVALALSFAAAADRHAALAWAIPALVAVVVIVDAFLPPRRRAEWQRLVLGGAIGLALAFPAQRALGFLPVGGWQRTIVEATLALVFVYWGGSAAWQFLAAPRHTGEPISPARAADVTPCLLDTSAIIDGRIADVVDAGFVDGPLVVPAFVVQEVQNIADSADKHRRARGRRGLDVLNRLKSQARIRLTIYDGELPEFVGQPVDARLVLLARHLGGKIVTGDYNLNQVAQLHDVAVLNLNDVARALRPAVLPGETLSVQIIKVGESAGQGVGYLDDGTMVVVEGAARQIGETLQVCVTSVLQTSAGRMIFGK